MTKAFFEDLGDGITCIDAAYVEPGMACFYLLEADGEYAVIETGTSRSLDNLQALMADRGIRPEQIRYVAPTHVHLDHAGGAGVMMAAFPRAQLLIHPRGARHMTDPGRLVAASRAVYGDALFDELYGEVRPVEPWRIREVADGERLHLGRRPLLFHHTEGHARHHFCLWDETSGGWFTGDMFGVCYARFRFPGGDFVLPSTTPTQFDPDAYLESLALLESCAPERVYLTHYGALDYTADKSRRLAEQVDAYRELAAGGKVAGEALEEALTQDALTRIREIEPRIPAEDLRRWLRFDLQLNAQGLRNWRERLGAAD